MSSLAVIRIISDLQTERKKEERSVFCFVLFCFCVFVFFSEDQD